MRAVLYTRVSSDPKEQRRSVAEQEAECRQVCDREGWTVVRVFSDNDLSASRYARRERPAYRELRDYLTDGHADVLVLWEGSRAQRDLRDYLALRDLCAARGILYSYSGRTFDLSRTDDRFTTGLDALLAEREADQTRDRVLRAVRANAAAGRPHGKLLYGYTRQYDERGTLVAQVPHPDHAQVVKEAARRVAAGEACYSIAKDFNTRGIPAPRGGRWDLTQIRRIVTNPGYAGLRVHRGQVTGPATWPALLDEETFAVCTSRMTDPRRRTVRDTAVKHLLTGTARCGPCGALLRVQKNRGFLSYLCPESFCVSIKTTHLEGFVTDLVVERMSRPDALELLARPGTDTAAADAEAKEKRGRLEEWYEAAARGDVSPAGLARIEARLLQEIAEAESRARAVPVPRLLRLLAGPGAADRWDLLSIGQRREVVYLLMDVFVDPTVRGARRFRPERVRVQWKD